MAWEPSKRQQRENGQPGIEDTSPFRLPSCLLPRSYFSCQRAPCPPVPKAWEPETLKNHRPSEKLWGSSGPTTGARINGFRTESLQGWPDATGSRIAWGDPLMKTRSPDFHPGLWIGSLRGRLRHLHLLQASERVWLCTMSDSSCSGEKTAKCTGRWANDL